MNEKVPLRGPAIDGVLWGVGGKLGVIAANLVTLMVTSRLLTPLDFGIVAAGTIAANLAIALANSSFSVPIVQRLDLSERELRAGFTAFLIMGLLIAAGTIAVAPFASGAMEAPGLLWVLWAIAAIIPLKLMSGFYGALLQRRLDMRYYQLTQNVPQVLGGCVVTLITVSAGWGMWSLVAGLAATTTLEFAMVFWRVRLIPKMVASAEGLGQFIGMGIAAASNRLVEFVAGNADKALVGGLLGPHVLGIYSRSHSLTMVPVKLLGLAISKVSLPIFSSMQSDDPRLSRALTKVISAQTLIYMPIGVGFAVATPLLVNIALGRGWSEVILPAEILFVGVFARLGYVSIEGALLAVGAVWEAARRKMVYASGVVAAGILSSYFGLLGVVVGVTLALFLFYALTLRQALVRFGCPVREIGMAHLRAIALCLCGLLAASVVDRMVHLPTILIPLELDRAAGYWGLVGGLLLLSPSWMCGSAFSELRKDLLGIVLARGAALNRRVKPE